MKLRMIQSLKWLIWKHRDDVTATEVPGGLIQTLTTNADWRDGSIDYLKLRQRPPKRYYKITTKILIVAGGNGDIVLRSEIGYGGWDIVNLIPGMVVFIPPGTAHLIRPHETEGLDMWMVSIPATCDNDEVKV